MDNEQSTNNSDYGGPIRGVSLSFWSSTKWRVLFPFRKYCGRNSPKFVYALQQLVQYSNEFIQDQSSVDLSQVNKSICHHLRQDHRSILVCIWSCSNGLWVWIIGGGTRPSRSFEKFNHPCFDHVLSSWWTRESCRPPCHTDLPECLFAPCPWCLSHCSRLVRCRRPSSPISIQDESCSRIASSSIGDKHRQQRDLLRWCDGTAGWLSSCGTRDLRHDELQSRSSASPSISDVSEQEDVTSKSEHCLIARIDIPLF